MFQTQISGNMTFSLVIFFPFLEARVQYCVFGPATLPQGTFAGFAKTKWSVIMRISLSSVVTKAPDTLMQYKILLRKIKETDGWRSGQTERQT